MQPQDLEDLIAVARLTGGLPGKTSRYGVTVGGDGLADLKPPIQIWLHRPAYRGNDLKKILSSVKPHPRSDGFFAPVELLSRKVRGKGKGEVRLKLPEDFTGDDGDLDLMGWWLCCEREQLAATGEVYVFQMIGLAVHRRNGEGEPFEEQPVATVTGYIETGAHGLLETRTLATGDAEPIEVLVPLVPEYAELDLPNKRVYVRGFDDLIV
ncbi:MAG: hypothetical protein NXI24_20035 [bacterium]|nr:hypothetical protein [bacterium]